MAYEVIRPNFQLPVAPGSNLVPFSPVRLGGSNALLAFPLGSNNLRPFAMNGEATAPVSGAVNSAVQGFSAALREEGNIVKAIAGASLGAGAEVAIATYGVATIAQGGSAVATVGQFGVAAGASGVAVWAAGISLDAVAAGEIFTLYFKPRQISGLV